MSFTFHLEAIGTINIFREMRQQSSSHQHSILQHGFVHCGVVLYACQTITHRNDIVWIAVSNFDIQFKSFYPFISFTTKITVYII